MQSKNRFFIFLVPAGLALLAGLFAGLLRLGMQLPVHQSTWASNLVLLHGPLMVLGFLSTLIGLERAVALKKAWVNLCPLFACLGALALIFGENFGLPTQVAPLLMAVSSFVMSLAFVSVLFGEFLLHHIVMALGAFSLLVGNLFWLFGFSVIQVIYWWMAFLLLTIAGERLELSRLLMIKKISKTLFAWITGLFLLGLGYDMTGSKFGTLAIALCFIFYAIWFFKEDIARRTVRQTGLVRFIAVCLLSGYIWLAVSGMLLIFHSTNSLGVFGYDAILHSFFLGFVFSMIFGHGPIIFPAITGRAIHYSSRFYGHWIILQIGLSARVVYDLEGNGEGRLLAGQLNAVAVVLFIFNMALSLNKNLFRKSTTPYQERKNPTESRIG